MRLYHTGFQMIQKPDIRHGRKNADFGPGFYLTDDPEFARRWARERKDEQTIVNSYELDVTGLSVHTFSRDQDWFACIFGNRRGRAVEIPSDVIIGPIANDTIYDTFGIITSGLLKDQDALRLLMIGPEYRQIVLKTKKAVENLKWISAEVLGRDEISAYRKIVSAEEEEYQRLFAKEVEQL